MLERLQKIIGRAGIASRRHAEDLIRSGQVRVNGVVITELGAKADPERDRVEAAGRIAQLSETRVYLLMNKPTEVVSTLADPEGRRTLRNFLVGVTERVFPVGRLDYAVGGAVFLTNDGELASRMLKASPSLPQTYWVKVKGRLSDTQVKSLANMLHGKMFPLRGTHAAGKNPPNPWYEVQITGVRRDLLRKNLLGMGHPVEKMRRMKLASLDADTVEEGHYRQITPLEVAKLGRAVELALKEHKPIAKGFKPRREWRPRREMVRNANDGKALGAGGKEQGATGSWHSASEREQRVMNTGPHSGGRGKSAARPGQPGGGREQGTSGSWKRPGGGKNSGSGDVRRSAGREQRAGDRWQGSSGRKKAASGSWKAADGKKQGGRGRGHRPSGKEQRPSGKGQHSGGREQRPDFRRQAPGGRGPGAFRKGPVNPS